MDQVVYVSFGSNDGGILLDIGEGGLSCRVVGALMKGESCQVKFVLPGETAAIEANCFVEWATPSKKRGGLQFVDLSEASKLLIREWIAKETSTASTRTVVMATKMNPIAFGTKIPTPDAVPAAVPTPIEPEKPAIVDQGIHSLPSATPTNTEFDPKPANDGHIFGFKSADRIPSTSSSGTLFPVQSHAPEKKVVGQPWQAGVRVSAAWMVACLGFLAAVLILAFYSGRLIGVKSVVARVDTASPSSPSVGLPPTPAADIPLPSRSLDPTLINTGLQSPLQTNGIANKPATAVTPQPNVTTGPPAQEVQRDFKACPKCFPIATSSEIDATPASGEWSCRRS